MKTRSKPEHDEREISLRTRVHSHGLALLIALVLLDAVLGAAGVNWAAGRAGGFVLAALAFLAVRLEHIFRNVSYGRRRSPKWNIMFLLLVAAGCALFNAIAHVQLGAPALAADGLLTLWGCNVTALALLVAALLCDVGKVVFDLRREARKKGLK